MRRGVWAFGSLSLFVLLIEIGLICFLLTRNF